MFIHRRRPHEPVGGEETPEDVYVNRRRWLRRAGLGAGAAGLAAFAGYRWWRGSDQQVIAGGQIDLPPAPAEEPEKKTLDDYYPASRDTRFSYGRKETDRIEAARYTNFYEFSRFKDSWRHVEPFEPYPWTLTVTGLCRNELKIDIDAFYGQYGDRLVDRQYRHRCVEKWAMAIPWSGLPLAALLKDADPLAAATHVRFVSFFRPDQAPNQRRDQYPWPYAEGLTLAEAMHDLTFLATGIYGRPLIKQHGAPFRVVVPWKYGFKSIKSIDRIELVDREPATFWSTLNPIAYPFQSNVDPQDTVPWSQREEWMLGTREVFPTQPLNGYAEYVADLYS